MRKKLLLSSLLFCQLLTAQIVMPDFFSNGMVLQQQTDAAIWGVDNPNTKIAVKGSWEQSVSGKTDQN
jgi:sialate O-acetylesterase